MLIKNWGTVVFFNLIHTADLSVMEDLAAGEIKHSAQPPPVTIITEEMRVRHAEHVQKGLKRAAAAAERKAAALRQKQERTRRHSRSW